MTPAEQAAKFFTDFVHKHSDRLGYLWGRWQDEREYEDFATYAEEMKKLAEPYAEQLTFLRATKRPFAMVCKYKPLNATISFNVTGRSIGWSVK